MSYGNWELKNDTLTLIPVDNKTIDVIDTIITTGTDTGKIAITILDKNGVNMTDKIEVVIRRQDKNVGYFQKDYLQTAEALIIPREEGSFALSTLEFLFRRRMEFPITKASNYVIKLKLTQDYVYNTESDWFDLGISQFIRINNYFMSIPENSEDVLYFIRKPQY